MAQELASPASTILLIEGDSSLRRLMTLTFQHVGLRVIETSSISALPAPNTGSLDLIVLDIDASVYRNWSLLEQVRSLPECAGVPVVLLSWNTTLQTPTPETSTFLPFTSFASRTKVSPLVGVTHVSKPFDARALCNVVTRLLKEQAEQRAVQEAAIEARLLTTYKQHTFPTIWPLVTAAGLLLLMVGMLLQFALAAAGLLLGLVGLLFWTLGTKPETQAVSASAGTTS